MKKFTILMSVFCLTIMTGSVFADETNPWPEWQSPNGDIIIALPKEVTGYTWIPESSDFLSRGNFVKQSKTKICYEPRTANWEQTKTYSTHLNIEDCIQAGGSLPNNTVKKEVLLDSNINVPHMIVRCGMYVNAMIFDESGPKLQDFLTSQLREMGVGRDQEVQIRKGMRKIIKQSGVTFIEQMNFLSNDCKALGLTK